MGKTLHPLVPYCALRLGSKIRMEWWQKSFCFFQCQERILRLWFQPREVGLRRWPFLFHEK
jgi:hypothetical protein